MIISRAPVMITVLGLAFLLQAASITGQTNITFLPDGVEDFFEDEEIVVQFNLTSQDAIASHSISAASENEVIAEVVANATQLIADLEELEGIYMGQITVRGKRLGRADIEFFIHETGTPPTEEDLIKHNKLQAIVLRKRRVVDDVFRYGIITLASILYIGFGCKINIKTIWQILKKPISPAIGFVSQFVVMPLLGFGLGQIFSLENALSFGLLTLACSPGGGSSNVWVSLFDGDLDLSLTMTTVSTFASIGMMPLWLYALGHFYLDPTEMSIPYVDLVRTLLTIIVPCAVGLVIRYFLPKVADKIAFLTRPFSGIFVVYILTFGTYVNLYMYEMMGDAPEIIPAAMLLPFLGYACGLLLAIAARRKMGTAVTISIETGVQNASIPIVVLQGSFPQPEGDVAAVMPVASSLFFNIPIIIAWIIFIIYRRYHPKTEEESDIPIEKDIESYDLGGGESSNLKKEKPAVGSINEINADNKDADKDMEKDRNNANTGDSDIKKAKEKEAFNNKAFQAETINQKF